VKRILSTGFYYVTSIFSNFFRYVFHLVLLRLLAPGEYGEFSSYLSLLYILGIPTVIITNVVTKYVADFRGKGDAISINKLFYFLLNKINLVTIPVGLLLIIFSQPLAVLFKAHPLAFVILGISMFVSVFQAIINSYVLAFQKIVFLTVIGMVNVLMTIGLAVLFIKFGWGATGVVGAQILSGVAYIEVAGWLPYIVFTMAFFAFSQFIISYLMATNRPRATVLLLVATIVQPVLFFIFRNSFNDIIIANFVLQLGLFLALVLYIVRKDFFAGFKICMQTKDLFQFVL